MDYDKSFVEEGDLAAAQELIASAAKAELFLYAGNRHLFADNSLPSYDESAAGLLVDRVLLFLHAVFQLGPAVRVEAQLIVYSVRIQDLQTLA